ncbi:MAG: PqiC family protein [Magnetococcus sp. DMHC-6]
MVNGFNRFGWIVLLVPLWMMGCTSTSMVHSDTTRYFLLSANVPPPLALVEKRAYVQVDPLDIPEYLNRPEIVIRAGAQEMVLSDFNHWGEDLSANLTRVLEENLANLLPDISIDTISESLPLKQRGYRLSVKIIQFELASEEKVVLRLLWRLYSVDERRLLAIERWRGQSERLENRDYPLMVASMNRLLEEVSRKLALVITEIDHHAAPIDR